ncbi:MAG: DnrO protein [Rhodanobacteraceae bacterium]|nr:DnrO protein [Rhodanobacteraceae bacterium]MBK7044466.1 DnrO protein [Rhodanobacteraceae bacterium]MBP9154467.1 DnrO protein [Xanthomonadales bacterium]HQW80623.1 DnrO protein [Pseudomonadota bacterium]
MKSWCFLLPAMLMFAVPYALAEDGHDAHTQDHSAHTTATDAPAIPAERWSVDQPLQTGMSKVRIAIESLAHHEMGHLDATQVVALAAEIDTQVKYMIANCKLDPQADAALHGIIGRLLTGSHALTDKPDDAAPVAGLREALADYPKYFNDPKWTPLPE